MDHLFFLKIWALISKSVKSQVDKIFISSNNNNTSINLIKILTIKFQVSFRLPLILNELLK